MPRRGKKKDAVPLLVAPEPLGDELEADMLWDDVKEVDDKPLFMDGSLVDATRAAFEGEKGRSGAGEAARTAFSGRTRHLGMLRARDEFLVREEELKEAMDDAQHLREDVVGFEALRQTEEGDFQQERVSVTKAAMGLTSELADGQLMLLEDMEELANNFLDEQYGALDSLCALAARGAEVDAAFMEQQTMREKCRRDEQTYLREHGDHVVRMAKMKEETKRQQNEMLQTMLRRLETGVDEMTKLSMEELEDTSAQQDEMSQLVVELLKLQGQSVDLEKKTTAIAELRTSLQRMIALEVQKQELCVERQKQLRAELKSLTGVVRENDLRLLEMTSGVVPTAAYTAALPMISTSPNTISGLTDSEGEKSLTLHTIEARHQLEFATAELAKYKNELWALRRKHLVQLSGQYQPVNLDHRAMRTTQDFFLDAETSAAVRSVVVESLLEVNQSLCVPDGAEEHDSSLERLLAVTDPEERKAIQDYVARRINKLFSCVCPTAPPLVFLREAAHVQSEV